MGATGQELGRAGLRESGVHDGHFDVVTQAQLARRNASIDPAWRPRNSEVRERVCRFRRVLPHFASFFGSTFRAVFLPSPFRQIFRFT